ncbi:MAG TPA: cell envelope integrity EipB family protein [Stellaceae bacterium]|nr:cell envelope integrity EipB family protein [Stellaceae bacterium]
MMNRPHRVVVLAAAAMLLAIGQAWAVDVAPHRALYTMTLSSARPKGGVVGATGTLAYKWGETCDGWTIEQRYKLNMEYEDDKPIEITSNFVTWESKDGLRYRFNERKTRNGDVEDEIRGDAMLGAGGKGGTADFVKPKQTQLELPPGTLFPTAHTLMLINKAEAGETFIGAKVFDGASADGAVTISAVIGQALPQPTPIATGPNPTSPAPEATPELKSPLLDRKSWNIRMAFFPDDDKAQEPDYELGMRLLDNGVSAEMSLDYGDFAMKAKLKELEALPKPTC